MPLTYASPVFTTGSMYPIVTESPQLYVNQPRTLVSPSPRFETNITTGSGVQAYMDSMHQQLLSNYQTYYENAYQQPVAATTYPTTYQQNGYLVPPLWLTETGASSWLGGTYAMTPDTPEALAERKRQAKLDDRAGARAKALLLEHLDDVQRAEYEENRYFHVIGQSGKVYRLKHGYAGNIYELGLDGNELHKYCVHFSDRLPTEDHMLGQLLRLKYDEEQLLTLANRHW